MARAAVAEGRLPTGAPTDLSAALQGVRARIEAACARAGRAPGSVALVAVSKGVAIERLLEARAAGLTDLGESRVQEAAPKIAALSGLRWHMVGRLQSNKARRAVELFDEVHSVDSVDLAQRLSRAAVERGRGALAVYLQANVDGDPAKAGFTPDGLAVAIGDLAALPELELGGLMTVGRSARGGDEGRATFAALRELSLRLRDAEPALGAGLSMGMSDDFEAAIEEGATVVRVGRALFGDRSPG